jgi:orotate phosphoribosyltransferase-like protein
MSDKLVKSVVDLRNQGLSMRKIATELNISTFVVQKSLKTSVI